MLTKRTPGDPNHNRDGKRGHPTNEKHRVKSGKKNKLRGSKDKKRQNFYISCFLLIGLLSIVNFVGYHKIEVYTPLPPTPVANSPKIAHSFPQPVKTPNKTVVAVPPVGIDLPSFRRKPTNHACDGYEGVYLIEKGDAGGAAGTVFFQFVIGQLIWAEMYNFKPWVFLNPVSYVIYDPVVHGKGPGVTFPMMDGAEIETIYRPDGHWRDIHPGKPLNLDKLRPRMFHLNGTGVWEHYFEPVSDFVPGDESCTKKPLITMNLKQVTPGVHGFSPWSPRCWRYEYLPDYITQPHVPLQEWLEPQRKIAHAALTKYIKLVPSIRDEAERLNPECSLANSCLALHIRQSDKAAGRRQVQTHEFLPYAEAFVKAGGKWIYLATDSGTVMNEVKTQWPSYLQDKIRSIGDDVVRSSGHQAVFDLAAHHRTNLEILVEILAISKCQFMVHGLSAVTESSIWINLDLHDTSVNLEDPECFNPEEFGSHVKNILAGGNATELALQLRPRDWWKVDPTPIPSSSNTACAGKDGILLISNVGENMGAGPAFFGSVLNQLHYAEMNNLKPWVYLGGDSSLIYDDIVHINGDVAIENMSPAGFLSEANANNSSFVYPGRPVTSEGKPTALKNLRGDGIWTHYFDQVSDFVPGDASCDQKPIFELDSQSVRPGIYSFAPWAIRAWRNNDVPDDLWYPNGTSYRSWMQPMRERGHELVERYFKVLPHILQRVHQVNPVDGADIPCLAIHLRNGDKGKNLHRSKFPVPKFRDHINAFVRAGGKSIYVASDSHAALEYIRKHFPKQISEMIRSQGPYVVRPTSKWPSYWFKANDRMNSELLVDVLAMSKCSLLLHGHSTASEAAIYLNPTLHNNSVNWEDPDHISAEEFELLARKVLGTENNGSVELETEDGDELIDQPIRTFMQKTDTSRQCRKNAIVYLAQKSHSSYARNSYGILLDSLELMNKNYLSQGNNRNNTDLIIFHTADFNASDLDVFEERFGPDFRQLITLVDLEGTKYWRRPSWHKDDDPFKWFAYPKFSEGYRRMMHWFGIDIWNFFADLRNETGCDYEYIMRFDEDSFLHSPIKYDVFDFMKGNDYNYGFRLCAYEMQYSQQIWSQWKNTKGIPTPYRELELEMCGIYNNFFVAKVEFFRSKPVQRFLHFIDRKGVIYRRRFGDLMIHTLTVFAFSPPGSIHRFLDFTYEHATIYPEAGCVGWGGIQAGYDDPNSNITLGKFLADKVEANGCTVGKYEMGIDDLSPTYAHLPPHLNGKVTLSTIMAGNIERAGQGRLSG